MIWVDFTRSKESQSMKKIASAERVTVSVPAPLRQQIEQLKSELAISQSEFFQRAAEHFIQLHQKQKMEQAALKMAPYYASDPELTAFNVLDGEAFK
jgi:hypothetical protein